MKAILRLVCLLSMFFLGSGRVDAADISIRHGLWNTHLNLINVVEVNNSSSETQSVRLSIFDHSGKLVRDVSFRLKAFAQRDILLNGFEGGSDQVKPNTYGSMTLSASLSVVARSLFYVPSPSGGALQLGAAEGFSSSRVGESYLLANTFNPDKTVSGLPIQNWLSLVNLSPSRNQTFTVQVHSASGAIANSYQVKVGPRRRMDMAVAGPENKPFAGRVTLIPANLSLDYVAGLSRVGTSSNSNDRRPEFIHRQTSMYPAGRYTWYIIPGVTNAQTWLEISNLKSQAVAFKISVYSQSKGLLSSTPLQQRLPKDGTRHILVNSYLSSGEPGAVQLESQNAGDLAAFLTNYSFDTKGSVESVAYLGPESADKPFMVSAYNTFEQAGNVLNLFNTSSRTQEATIILAVKQTSGSISNTQQTVRVSSKRGTSVDLNRFGNLTIPANTYGSVLVTGRSVVTMLTRTVNAESSGGRSSTFGLNPAPPKSSIYMPKPDTSWHIQYSGTLDTSLPVEMFDLDLFDTPTANFSSLQSRGKAIACYFSAGSWEDWRDDAKAFPATVLGHVMDGWPGEKWLDIRRIDKISPIMLDRLTLAVQRGCHAVDPDNVNGYVNDTGFPLDSNHQIRFNSWLADEAHLRGLSIGLKNDLDQIPLLVDKFDWALNEECFQFGECAAYIPFVQANKAVFGIEYEGDPVEFCPLANASHFSWLLKNLELDAWSLSCLDQG